MSTLTAKQQSFVEEYLVDLNATQAAIRAGYNPKTARAIASENLSKPAITEAIANRQADRLLRVEVSQDDVIRVLVDMLAADANELVEHRRHCCRFCWGEGFRYQYTANEMEKNQEAWLADTAFDEKGGIGYDERKDPNPKCPECFGDGVSKTIVKDTRKLSPSARALYAGIKQTKDGLEVKMQSKEGYIQLLMRHAGMLNDKLLINGKMVHEKSLDDLE
jgi:phage terminase small subunit